MTFAWAIAPDDAGDPAALVHAADERLMARKRDAKRRESQAAPA
ncbi:MAG: hypothetical protein ACRDM7_11230 [Thermoleophilaceae bacterium]